MIKDVYAKGLPSIFVVWSPFQAMCAVEAIRDFEIIELIFQNILIEYEGNSPDNFNITSIKIIDYGSAIILNNNFVKIGILDIFIHKFYYKPYYILILALHQNQVILHIYQIVQ